MDTIEKWVREQLEEGYTPEQIKISLQKSGYDSAIVDKILNIKQENNIMAKKKTSKSEKFDVKPIGICIVLVGVLGIAFLFLSISSFRSHQSI